MEAGDLFRSGQLKAAIDAQLQKVKSAPTDRAARLFLFELLLFSGDLDRARKHLDLLQYDNPQANASTRVRGKFSYQMLGMTLPVAFA